jgi:tRNA(Ser,Leu) C12 N-acetylase TAN1
VYDFNLLVSISRGGYQAARRVIGAILRAMGDEGPVVSRTPVRGLVGVRTGFEPRHVIRELRARQEREAGCPQLVRILADPVTAKVDLDHPDKILRVDIVGEQAAVSVLAPDEVFSVARSPARH